MIRGCFIQYFSENVYEIGLITDGNIMESFNVIAID